MTNPTPTLLDLASRVEGLTRPCRDTDVAIWAAITPADTYRRLEPGKSYSTWQIRDDAKSEWRDYYPGLNAERYTGSLDAAMTLVPEGWWLTLDRYLISDNPEHDAKTWRVWLKRFVGDLDGNGPCYHQKLFAGAATPALALTAASLRALAALEGGHG